MRAIIRKTIEEISALPMPRDLLKIQNIFAMFSEFSTFMPSDDKERECIQQLVVIQKLAKEGIELQHKERNLRQHDAEYAQYQLQITVLEEELHGIEERITQLRAKEALQRHTISSQYTHFLSTIEHVRINELIGEPAEITKKQARHAKELQKKIQDELFVLELPTKKLKLLQLNDKQNALLSQFMNLPEFLQLGLAHFNPTRSTALSSLREFVRQSQQHFIALAPQFASLQALFAQSLSGFEARKKTLELESQQANLIKTQQELKRQITEFPLNKELKSTLTEQFEQCLDTDTLIQSYVNKTSSVGIYVNPVAWYSWAMAKENYEQKQKELHASAEFITLLKKQRERMLEGQNLSTRLDALSNISNACEYNEEQKDSLIAETQKLINSLAKYALPIAFALDTPATECYLILIECIPLIAQKIKTYETLIAHLDVLIPIMAEQEELRTIYNLSREQDNLLPSPEELISAIPANIEQELTKKYRELTQCDAFIEQFKKMAEQLKGVSKQQIKIGEEQETIVFNLKVLQRALENKRRLQIEYSFSQQIANLRMQMDMMQQDIAHKLMAINGVNTNEASIITSPVPIKQDAPPEPASPLVPLPEMIADDAGHVQPISPQAQVTITGPLEDTEQQCSEHNMPTAAVDSALEQKILLASPTLSSSDLTPSPNEEDLSLSLHSLQVSTVTLNVAIEEVADISANETTSLKSPSEQEPCSTEYQATEQPPIIAENKEQALATAEYVTASIPADLSTDGLISSESEELSTEVPPMAPNYRDELEQLHYWHQKNMLALNQYSKEVKNWYLKLFNTSEQAIQNSIHCYKYVQLMRDVAFAFAHKLDTISCYQRMCPQPQEQCDVLLALKPNVPIARGELFDSTGQLPRHFHAALQHYRHLKVRHPLEAELLAQALHSLLYVYQSQEQTVKTNLRYITDDPKYDLLKRHRGFLKVWQLVEDIINFIMGIIKGKAEQEQHKPCFFKTRSLQLLEQVQSQNDNAAASSALAIEVDTCLT